MRACVRVKIFQSGLQRRRLLLLWRFDRSPGRPIQETQNLSLSGRLIFFQTYRPRFQDGVLRVGAQHVLLRRAAHRIAGLGHAHEGAQQFLAALDGVDRHIGVVQLVIGHLDSRHHAQAHREVLLEFRFGFLFGDLAAELALARKRYFLRDREAHIAGGVAAQPATR